MSKMSSYAGYGAFGMALVATLASLALSEVLHWAPCELCWYQRIFMYPLVFIIGISILRRDGSWPFTTLVMAGIGWLIALYHTLLQWKIIPSSLSPCTGGVPCVTDHDAWFGFVTIPFLSFVAFTVIIIMTAVHMRGVKGE